MAKFQYLNLYIFLEMSICKCIQVPSIKKFLHQMELVKEQNRMWHARVIKSVRHSLNSRMISRCYQLCLVFMNVVKVFMILFATISAIQQCVTNLRASSR